MEEYLMVVKVDDKEYAVLTTEYDIIDHIDMDDCTYEEIEVYRVAFGNVERLHVHGTWHNFDDPLYIKVTDDEGNTVFDGYGTDH